MGLQERLLQFVSYKRKTVQAFEKESGISNGAVAKMGDNTRRSTLDKIANAYPELNVNWLLTGEGEMLNPNVSQTVNGDNNTSVAGNGNQVNASALIEELAAQRRLTEKAQEQIDRLLTLLEKHSN